MKKSAPYRSWFTLFCLYNLVFLLFQLGFVFSRSHSFIHAIPLPAVVYLELGMTLFIHFVLYLLLAVLQTALIWGLMAYRLSRSALERWHLVIWSLSICALLFCNAYFFPLSTFSRLFFLAVPQTVLITLLLGSLLPLCLLLLNTLFCVSRMYPISTGGFLMIGISLLIYDSIKPMSKSMRNSAPNIIVIGVDSLSPKSINTKDTPTLARFIDNSVLFKETISPLARTYPAWSSILTGLYPHHHHARYNLMPPDLVKSSQSIAWLLQQKGYQTIFATDDRRFNSLDETFGFQKIIGPKLGANDVLLGTLNDFPLSNLLVNLPMSRWLFPYNYINRASHFSYYPQSFDKALQNTLASRNNSSPVFMAVHFTLSHWPYAWAKSPPAQVKDEYSVEERGQLYLASLQQVDKQVAHLLQVLQQYDYLANSLVVLLSDHGETMYVPGSRQTSALTYQGHGVSKFADYLKRKTSTALDMSVGHGSDLLSTDQYHCMLAFRIYRHNQLATASKVINTRVALIDIAPTIQAYLDMQPSTHIDGISLLSMIIGNNEPTSNDRAFVMESGMLPNQFLTRDQVRIAGQKFFTIDSRDGHLHIHKKELSTLDAQKLYAVIQGNWVLALYPDDGGYLAVVLNLQDSKWIDNLDTDYARKSPSLSLLNVLHHVYQRKWPIINR